MSIYKLAPASVVASSPENDVQKLMFTSENLIAGSRYLFSCSSKHPSIIVNGENAGMPLMEVLAADDFKALGSAGASYQNVPFAIRKLDPAADEIIYSAQKAHHSFWYVTDAADGSEIFLARPGAVDPEQFAAAVENGAWKPMLQPVPVSEGDIFAMRPGVACALTHGVSVLEIETTVADVEPETAAKEDFHQDDYMADGQGECATAGRNSVIEFDLYRLDGRLDLNADARTCKVLVFLHGEAVIDNGDETIHAQKDTVLFVPADTPAFHITGNCAFALVHLV